MLALGSARSTRQTLRAIGQRSSALTWTPASHRQRSRHTISALGSARGTEQLLRLSWSSLGLPGRSWQLRLSWILQRVPAALGASRVPLGLPRVPRSMRRAPGAIRGLPRAAWEVLGAPSLGLPGTSCGSLRLPDNSTRLIKRKKNCMRRARGNLWAAVDARLCLIAPRAGVCWFGAWSPPVAAGTKTANAADAIITTRLCPLLQLPPPVLLSLLHTVGCAIVH